MMIELVAWLTWSVKSGDTISSSRACVELFLLRHLGDGVNWIVMHCPLGRGSQMQRGRRRRRWHQRIQLR